MYQLYALVPAERTPGYIALDATEGIAFNVATVYFGSDLPLRQSGLATPGPWTNSHILALAAGIWAMSQVR